MTKLEFEEYMTGLIDCLMNMFMDNTNRFTWQNMDLKILAEFAQKLIDQYEDLKDEKHYISIVNMYVTDIKGIIQLYGK